MSNSHPMGRSTRPKCPGRDVDALISLVGTLSDLNDIPADCVSFGVHLLFWVCVPTARLRVKIDCEAITAPDAQGGATGMVVAPQEPQAQRVQGAVTSNQPQAENTTVSLKENVGIPSTQGVMNFIAFKCFQSVDTSKPEELNGYLQYLKQVRKVLFVDAQPGSLIITVECSSLQILEELWEDYCTGHLNEVAQKFLVTEDLLKAGGFVAVKLKTTIAEEEYRDCREYFLKRSGKYNILSHLCVPYNNCSAVFSCLETLMKQSHSLLKCYLKHTHTLSKAVPAVTIEQRKGYFVGVQYFLKEKRHAIYK